VKWDIFAKGKRQEGGEVKDQIEELVKRIERFAPRKYKSERSLYYYNYKLMDPYLRPLLELLQTLSQFKRLKEDPDFLREVFLKLKGFYDRKNSLSLAEAIDDRNLRRRFRDLLLFFYGKRDLSGVDMKRWIDGP
jgi:hypothetical protein